MFRHMLRSKIHRATVTEACLGQERSLWVDEELLEAAGIVPCQAVVCSNALTSSLCRGWSHRFSHIVSFRSVPRPLGNLSEPTGHRRIYLSVNRQQ